MCDAIMISCSQWSCYPRSHSVHISWCSLYYRMWNSFARNCSESNAKAWSHMLRSSHLQFVDPHAWKPELACWIQRLDKPHSLPKHIIPARLYSLCVMLGEHSLNGEDSLGCGRASSWDMLTICLRAPCWVTVFCSNQLNLFAQLQHFCQQLIVQAAGVTLLLYECSIVHCTCTSSCYAICTCVRM